MDLELFRYVCRSVFVTLSWPKKLAIDRLTHPQKRFFEAGFSHTLGIKSAITRTTHPQHSFSKGGGFAKRPQYSLLIAAGCCCLLLFAAGCCYLLWVGAISLLYLVLFAAVCRYLHTLFLCKDLPPKSTLAGPKIDHLGTQKSLKNRWKIDQNWFWELPGPPPGQVGFNLEALGRFLVIFGTPLRAPKQPKVNPWPKTWSQGPCFHRFVMHSPFYSIL